MSKTVMILEELRDAAVVYKGLLNAGFDVENINFDTMKVEYEYFNNAFLVSFVINSNFHELFIEHTF